jgi:diguanylate cyclase (GGDEF)-like protein/PAS domain S-box-containing protein
MLCLWLRVDTCKPELKQRCAATLILGTPQYAVREVQQTGATTGRQDMSDDNTQLRAAIDSMHTPIYIKDLDGRYIYANDVACAMRNLPRSQVIGKRDADLFPKDTADIIKSHDQHVITSGQSATLETYLPNTELDGMRCFLSLKQPLFDEAGQVNAVAGITIDIDERKRHENELIALKNQFAATLQAIPDLMFELDLEGRYHAHHVPRDDLMTVSASTLLGQTIWEVLPPLAARTCHQALKDALAHGFSIGHQFRLDLEQGPEWFELSVAQKAPIGNEPPRFIALSRHITQRKLAEQALQESESMLRAMVDNTPVAYWARDLDGRCIMENAMVVTFVGSQLGKTLEESGLDADDLIAWQEHNRRAYAGEVVDVEHTSRATASGDLRIFHILLAPIKVAGNIVGIVGFSQDITERKRHEERIHQLAFFDPLTQLPNRRLMFDRLEHALASGARHHRMGALLMIDLDHFKELNDTHGHTAGDWLLVEVAARLSRSIRQGDTTARLGGDEFVVILEDLGGAPGNPAQAATITNQIRDEFNQPFYLAAGPQDGVITYHCSASIGVALFGDVDITATELLRRVDTAMYQAKAAGRNTLCFFDPAMQAAAAARSAMNADLHEALGLGQFELHYQVQMDEQRRPTGAETLLRWRHPDKGMIAPASFIALAEDTGLIVPLGAWVLETACRQLAVWSTRPEMAHLSLAVNVSACQFRQLTFTDQVQQLLASTGAPANKLKLELTESTLIEDADAVVRRMEELQALGIRFSLDDFGTGYSSLTYLKRLPLAQLKIDQSFVRDLLTDANDAAIVKTIVALGNSLGLAVIAEGVETEDQLAFLAEHGCREYQGYLFSKPVPLAAFESLLMAGRHPSA